MSRENVEKTVGACFFVAFIAVHFLFGITAAIRVAGTGCLVASANLIFGRSIPIGIEGRPPSYILGGAGAVIIGVAMAALGVSLLLYPKHAACLIYLLQNTRGFDACPD